MAQETQYCSFRYIFGTVYSEKTEASEISRIAADSTMLRIVKRLMALSLGVQRLQLEQRMGFTWPRPFLLRPLDARFLTILKPGDELGLS